MLAPSFAITEGEVEWTLLRVDRPSIDRVAELSDHFARSLSDVNPAQPGIRSLSFSVGIS